VRTCWAKSSAAGAARPSVRRHGERRGGELVAGAVEVLLGDEEVEQVEHEQLAVLGRQVVGLQRLLVDGGDDAGLGQLVEGRARVVRDRDGERAGPVGLGEHLDRLLGAPGRRDPDGHRVGALDRRAHQAEVDVGPGEGRDADAVEPALQLLAEHRAAAHAVDVDQAASADALRHLAHDGEVDGRGGLAQRLRVAADQAGQQQLGGVVRRDLPADLVGPRLARRAAADVGGDADPQLDVAGVADHPAEAGDAGRGGPRLLARLRSPLRRENEYRPLPESLKFALTLVCGRARGNHLGGAAGECNATATLPTRDDRLNFR
jgi:hypothetical protein